jgi:hypothetical protein
MAQSVVYVTDEPRGIGCLRNHGHIGLPLDNPLEAVTHYFVVVYDDYPRSGSSDHVCARNEHPSIPRPDANVLQGIPVPLVLRAHRGVAIIAPC